MIKALFSAIFIAAGSLAAFGQNNSVQAPADPCGKIEPDIQSIPRLVDAIRKSTDAAVVQCLQMRLYEKIPENEVDLKFILSTLNDNRLAPYVLEGISRIKNPKSGDMLYQAFDQIWRFSDQNPQDCDQGSPCCGQDPAICEIARTLDSFHYNHDALALKEFRQYHAEVENNIRNRGLANVDGWVKKVRRLIDRDSCEEFVKEEENLPTPWVSPIYGVEDDPRVIDTYLYMIERSTVPICIKEGVESLAGSIRGRKNEKNVRARAEQWKRIGDTLIGVLNNENLSLRDWSIQIYFAAPALEEMGSPYRQAAYDWYLSALRKLAKEKTITDNRREFAMELVKHLLDADQKIPINLLREIVQKFDLEERSRPLFIRHPQSMEKVKQLLKEK